MKSLIRTGLALAVVLPMGVSCARLPYPYGAAGIEMANTLKLRDGEAQIERGKPNKVLDALDWVWPGSLLGKLILWNRKVDSHQISPETEEAIRDYLAKNNLSNVKVRVNQYAPKDEWRRLFKNKSVGAGWRYTFGVFTVLGYTILPGRVFGGDNYNPFTNTISLYSDLKPVAEHEGAHAKDFAMVKYKGTYAVASLLPFVSLLHESRATNDALGYQQAETPLENQQSGYKLLYPAYGTYIGGEAGAFIPGGALVSIAVVIPAHIVGRIKAAELADTTTTPGVAPAPETPEPAPVAGPAADNSKDAAPR